jgi:RNA recognition motif-containing protein
MAQPTPPPRRPLFDLNIAMDEFGEEEEEEPHEVLEEVLVEEEEVLVEEEEEEDPQEMIMEEDEEDAIVEKEVVEVAGGGGEDEGRRKRRKEYEVFVFGLPREATEDQVAGALAEAGEVDQVRLVRDPADPRHNKGFAFVRFREVWQARWAANDLRTAMVFPTPTTTTVSLLATN